VLLPIWQIHRHIGMGGDQLVKALAGDDVDAEKGDDIRAAEGALYLDAIESTEPFEGARALIERLKESGHEVVLASSAKAKEVDHYLDLLDARELVDSWTTSADVEETKPAPDLVQTALEKLDGDQAVMIGDTPWDVEAARNAGVDTIAVLTGGFSEQELREAGAVAVFESIAELLERIGETALG
jgi:HAD superfamily hydrolase (TIGR01549 family)